MESWDRVIRRYRELAAKPGYEPMSMILRLVERIAATPQAAKLRAGTSMMSLLISATDENLSSVEEPFISIAVAPDDRRLSIEYVPASRGPIDVARLVEEQEADDVLRPLFLRLWNETSSRV